MKIAHIYYMRIFKLKVADKTVKCRIPNAERECLSFFSVYPASHAGVISIIVPCHIIREFTIIVSSLTHFNPSSVKNISDFFEDDALILESYIVCFINNQCFSAYRTHQLLLHKSIPQAKCIFSCDVALLTKLTLSGLKNTSNKIPLKHPANVY